MKSIIMKAMALGVIAALLVVPLAARQAQPPQAGKSSVDKVNINSATLDDLQKLPRIGPKVAQRILEFRKQNGPFKRIEELMKVKGIGEKLFTQLKDQVTV